MWICPNCSEKLEEQFESCWNCGTGIDGKPVTYTFEAVSPIVKPVEDETSNHHLNFTAVGGSGWCFVGGHCYKVFVDDSTLTISGIDGHEVVSYDELKAVEIFGPGSQTTSAGVMGGGFGIEGAAVGIGIAGLINALSTQTTTNTYLRIATRTAEIFLHNSDIEPFELRILMSRACIAAENSKSSASQSLATNLNDLYSLFCKGALSESEFASAKTVLLANRDKKEFN